MKKLLAVISLLILFLIGAVYLFIPKNIRVAAETILPCSAGSAQRVTGLSEFRKKWFPPDAKSLSPTVYELEGCSYRFGTDASFSNNNINIQYKDIIVNSLLILVPFGDSLQVKWTFSRESNNNPVNRVKDYYQLKHIKKVNEKILNSLQTFCSSKKNIFGFDINRENQADSTLITLKVSTKNYPTVPEIYAGIERLNRYAAAGNATATNAPMLNIAADHDDTWVFMVALPVNKELNSSGEIIAKRMFAGGKILITEPITGGFATIESAMVNLEKYRSDHGFMSPAIPFQSLVTDRSREPDSLKWKTRLYYPVY